MKYFEIHDPYYALIKANNVESALEAYVSIVADDDGDLASEIEEVNKDYALILFSRALGEDGNEIPIKNILEDFNGGNEEVLIIDGGLL